MWNYNKRGETVSQHQETHQNKEKQQKPVLQERFPSAVTSVISAANVCKRAKTSDVNLRGFQKSVRPSETNGQSS